MAKTRDVITRFKFDLDRAKVAQLNASLDEILADVRGLSAEEVRLARSLKVATTELSNNQRGFQRAAQNAEQYQRAVRQGASELDRLALAQSRFDETSRRVALAGDVQSNLGAIRGIAGAAGAAGLGEGVGVAGELIALTEELPRLKAAAAGLPSTFASAVAAIGPAGLAIGAAAALAAVAIGDAANKIQADAESLRRIIEAQSEARLEIAGGQLTREQAVERFQKNVDRIRILEDELNNLREQEASQFENNVERFRRLGDSSAIADLSARLTDVFAGNLFTDSIDGVQAQIDSLSSQNFELGNALQDTATQFAETEDAADDAKAALEAESLAKRELARIAQEQIAADNRLIELRQLAISADRLSAEQIDERIQRNREQIELNSELVRSAAVGIDTQKRLQSETQQLIASNQVLAESLPAAQARAAAERLREVTTALAGIGRQRGVESTRFNQAVAKIATDLRDKLAKALSSRDNALSEAEREAGTARNEAVRDSGIRIAELERQTARERERIIRSANAGIANAIQDRDAVALLGAISARDEQLRQQKENYDDQRRQIDQQLAETNRQIVMRLAEQRRTINQRYSEQVADAQRAAQQQRQVEMQKNAQILADLRQAAQQALQIERSKNQSLTQSAIAAAQQISGVFSNIAQRVAMAAASRPTTSSQFGRPGGQIGPAPRPTSTPSLASGFTTAGLMQSRGVNVNIANAGVTPKIVGDTVAAAYSNFLRGFTS